MKPFIHWLWDKLLIKLITNTVICVYFDNFKNYSIRNKRFKFQMSFIIFVKSWQFWENEIIFYVWTNWDDFHFSMSKTFPWVISSSSYFFYNIKLESFLIFLIFQTFPNANLEYIPLKVGKFPNNFLTPHLIVYFCRSGMLHFSKEVEKIALINIIKRSF